ncbi:MAG: ArnT family glycosyltransferase [Pirellulaceae bacterium]
MSASEARGAVDDRVWFHRTLWLIGVLGAARVVYAFIVPLDLVHDEAYYWDWSRQLDWGYYSKPPMIAWLIGLSTSLGGSSAFVVRLPAVLLGTGGLAWIYLLASRLYGRRAGFWSVAVSAATPGNVVLSLLMTIDAPLIFCWGGALYGFWRFLERDTKQWLWLALATASVGLGLLSKQTMVGFLVLGTLFVMTSREDRVELTRPRLWLWVCGSLFFLAPVVWWNSQHDWITIQHTSGHFVGEPVSLLKRLTRSAEFLGSQFGVLSPVTCFLAWAVLVAAFSALRRLGRKERFLLCFSGLPLAGVLVLSLTQRIEPNWPAAFYPAAIVLMVGWALGKVDLPVLARLQPTALAQCVIVGGLFAAGTHLLAFGLGLEGSPLDAAVRMRGWQRLGETVAERYAELPRPDRTFVAVTAGRAVAAELAFYMPDQPRVFPWNSQNEILSQYDLWDGPTGRRGWDALLVTPVETSAPPELASSFEEIQDLGRIDVPIGSGRCHSYHLWHGIGFREWPEPRTHIARESHALKLR